LLSQPGTTRALQRAERNGNVLRRPDPTDGRAVVIELTATGRNVVEKAMSLLLQRFSGASVLLSRRRRRRGSPPPARSTPSPSTMTSLAVRGDRMATGTSWGAEVRVVDGLWFAEGPRWRDGALWCSDIHRQRVLRIDTENVSKAEVPHGGRGPG